MEYHQIIHNALEIVLKNIQPFIEDNFKKVYGNEFWIYMENGPIINSQMNDHSDNNIRRYKDLLFYLNAFIKNWNLFKGLFNSNYIICLCYDIKYFRNKWAHQSLFSTREVYRFLDQSQALLEEINLNTYEIEILRKAILEYFYKEEVDKNIASIKQLEPNNQGFLQHNSQINNQIQNNAYIDFQSINENNNYKHQNDENLTMLDGDEVDKNLLHYENYEKLMKNKNFDVYKISYYDEHENLN